MNPKHERWTINNLESRTSHTFFCFISDELTRLWNLNHDNMDACKSESRSDKVHLKFDSHFDTFISFILFGLSFLRTGNLFLPLTTSSQRPSSRPTLLTWWRTSISKCAVSGGHLRFPACLWPFWNILPNKTGSCGTQTTAGELSGCFPGEVRISFSQPIRSSRAWQITWTAWLAN